MNVMITFYSTKCPKCIFLKQVLDYKKIPYIEVNDWNIIRAKGLIQFPIIEYEDGTLYGYAEAIRKYIAEE